MILAVLALLCLVIAFIQTERGQNWLARQVTARFSRELQTRIDIKHVRFHFFNRMDLEGVLVEDQKKDTLLAAGRVRVRITDWFFFKDKAVLEYVGLDDAVVYFNRTDSVWNYDFLEKYFASSGGGQKKAGIEFDLKKVVMNRVLFVKKDAWIGNDLTIRVRGLDLDANEISATKKMVNIRNVSLDEPYFAIHDYQGNRPAVVNASSNTVAQADTSWNFMLGNASIRNGRFRLDNGSLTPTVRHFDGKHIDFSNITGTLKNVGWAKDTMRGNVDLTAVERSGLQVKALQAATTIHPKAMIFDRLYLRTNRSTLRDYFSMSYNSTADLQNFIHDVILEADFDRADISSDDIAFFAPGVADWNRNLRVNGRVKGTVDALAASDLELWAGNKTYLNGNVSIVGLPDVNSTLIHIEASDLRTTYADAVNFFPSLRRVTKPDLRKLSYIRFRGTYTGFVNDFVTFGTIQTALGTVTTDLNMKLPPRGVPQYSGRISTHGFQLGSFLDDPNLGIIDFHGTVAGRGFDWNTLDMKVDGVIHKFHYGDYTYQNITAKGTLKNRMFNGNFVIKDPNADLELTGLIDLRNARPLFDAKANIRYANLKALQLTPEEIILKGAFDLNLQGSDLADLLGSARVSNATLIHNGKEIFFDSLVVSSRYENGLKVLHARSNEFNATVTGSFDLNGLPDAFIVFLNRYYPAYIRPPRNVRPQAFTFDITTGVVEDYIRLIDPRLSGFNNAHITGSLDTRANNMTVDADVPQFAFSNYSFSDVRLKGSGDFQRLLLTGEVRDARIGDSLVFPQTTFSVEAQNDVSTVTVSTTANQAINQANLSARVNTFSDGLTINFNPSSFVLNGKTWSIEQGGELSFRRNTVVYGEVLLKESSQEILLETKPSADGTSLNDLHITLRNINLGDLSPFLLKKERLEGLVSGEVVIEDPENKMNITGSLTADQLRLDNDSLGQVLVRSIYYDNRTGMLTVRGNNTDPAHHIDFDVAMDLKDSANTFQDRITLLPTNFQLKFLERFLGSLFSDITGLVSGKIDIVGEGANRDYLAKARLRDAGFKVNFTQVFYRIDDTEIELSRDRIDFSNIRLRDANGRAALVNGMISHKSFQDMYYDIAVETESPNMLLLNTTYRDNQMFYGKAYGSGTFVLVGPQNNMLMNIDIRASEQDSSFITLPPSRSRESGQASFMVEKKYGREMSPTSLRGAATNLNYNITLAANPMVNMEVILDELTGDIIRGRGSGVLTINSGTSTPLTINGRYMIDEGSYEFTFQSFFKKPFVLRRGANNFIEWSGDPYDANINLDAVYTAEKVSFAPLANTLLPSSVAGRSLASLRDRVNVVATLTGNLFQPDFSFRLEFPSNSAIYRDPS
ncbi:MAG TPA: translocation/assembly module TamB domain-containing protein, partial [Flavisolibacter sp.]